MASIVSTSSLVTIVSKPVSPFDGKGDVVWYDDFESGRRWAFTPAANAAFNTMAPLANINSDGKGAVGYIQAPANGIATISSFLYLPNTTRVGVELSFLAQGFMAFEMRVYVYTGSQRHRHALYFNSVGGAPLIAASLYRRNASFNLVPVQLLASAGSWEAWKLVFNITTGQLVRALFGNLSFDLAGQSGEISANSTPQSLEIYLMVYSLVANQAVYIDNFILTKDEPER